MAMLQGPRRDALSGNTNSLCIILHGFGADGNDLIGLAEPLAQHLPDTTFIAPNAPDRCSVNPMGYQWFPIPWIDGSSEDEALRGIIRAGEILNRFVDDTMAEEGISPERVVLLGFSQGCMMSLDVGLRREAQLAGIIGFSGRLVRPEALADDIRTRPPVLLVHGDIDDVVPPSSMPEAADILEKNGVKTFTHVSQGMGHGIAPEGLGLALQFMNEVLPGPQDEAPEAHEDGPQDDEEDGFEGDDVSINFASERAPD